MRSDRRKTARQSLKHNPARGLSEHHDTASPRGGREQSGRAAGPRQTWVYSKSENKLLQRVSSRRRAYLLICFETVFYKEVRTKRSPGVVCNWKPPKSPNSRARMTGHPEDGPPGGHTRVSREVH